MVKKCIICGKPAMFCIKGTSDCYCEECAKENFSDLDLLQKIEEKAQELKKIIKEEIENTANGEKKEGEQYVNK